MIFLVYSYTNNEKKIMMSVSFLWFLKEGIMKYRFTKKIAWQIEPVNDYVYIYNIETQKFIILENLSKEIWLLIKERKSFDDIITYLQKTYAIEEDNLRKDISEFIGNILKEGVIELYE